MESKATTRRQADINSSSLAVQPPASDVQSITILTRHQRPQGGSFIEQTHVLYLRGMYRPMHTSNPFKGSFLWLRCAAVAARQGSGYFHLSSIFVCCLCTSSSPLTRQTDDRPDLAVRAGTAAVEDSRIRKLYMTFFGRPLEISLECTHMQSFCLCIRLILSPQL